VWKYEPLLIRRNSDLNLLVCHPETVNPRPLSISPYHHSLQVLKDPAFVNSEILSIDVFATPIFRESKVFSSRHHFRFHGYITEQKRENPYLHGTHISALHGSMQ
jgi:hypothetical protein